MKHARKLASLLLALVMVFALATTAFAAETTGSITISNPVDGQTYNAYLMFELESYNAETGAYSYKITNDWKEFVTKGDGGKYFSIDPQGYVTLKEGVDVANDSEAAATIAKAAVAYATSKSLDPTATLPKGGSYTASDLPLGYYVVDSSLGALCGLTTTNPSATISEKNEVPAPKKTVMEDSTSGYGKSNTAQIGDTVEFKIVIPAKKGAQNYTLHDQMEDGLTLNQNSITVKAGEKELAKDKDYTVDFKVDCKDKSGANATCDFEIRFTNDYLSTITADNDIVVTYTAVLNKNADATNKNDTVLDYGDGNHSEWDETTTKTFMFDIIKTKSNMEVLNGAKFELYDAQTAGNKIALVKVADGVYRVATAAEKNAEGFTSAVIEAGKATVKGLDAKTYWLQETEAPAGYNKLADRVQVKIDGANLTTTMEGNVWHEGDGGVQITNKAGTQLPSTGGMGTTIFYVLGSALVLGAVVLLVTKKRMSTKD